MKEISSLHAAILAQLNSQETEQAREEVICMAPYDGWINMLAYMYHM